MMVATRPEPTVRPPSRFMRGIFPVIISYFLKISSHYSMIFQVIYNISGLFVIKMVSRFSVFEYQIFMFTVWDNLTIFEIVSFPGLFFLMLILSTILKSKIPMNSKKGSMRFIKFRNGIFIAHTIRFKTKRTASSGTGALHFAAKKARAKPRINREIHLYIKNDVGS